MSLPKLLMLDEPSLGLAPILFKEVFKTIRQINAEGVTVLLVEQNVNLVLEFANRAYVLETGRDSFKYHIEEAKKEIAKRKADEKAVAKEFGMEKML